MGIPEFWIYIWFWVCHDSEYARVTQGSEYAWIILGNACVWVCLNFPEYPWIFVNMPKSARMTFLRFLISPFPHLFYIHFSCYTLMIFLMMLPVILLSMVMILLSFLSVIRHLIYDNNLNCPLNLNLIYETLWTRARSGLLISILGKLSWFCLMGLITLVLLMWKWIGLF